MLKVMDRRSFFGRALAGFAAVLGVKAAVRYGRWEPGAERYILTDDQTGIAIQPLTSWTATAPAYYKVRS